MESDTLELSPIGKKLGQNKLKPGIIVGIIVKDIVGFGFVIMVFLLAYNLKRKKRVEATMKKKANIAKDNWSITSLSVYEWCLRKRGEYEEKSDTREDQSESKSHDNQWQKENKHDKKGILVTVDGEKELELNTLLVNFYFRCHRF
ncbi:putative LRR receptor-like serine/threonine-protein kinase [Gossypium australe]|uniref:Putative LRR receptor-like serine/threonine-protein kinase n=1 Tax=Gossypium australe TaxID=47621 RepID=A0A5B6W2Z5_9ROSI|nr:putative LRR receptor-like serine/threonine-protein kinase [Gossypium australe]